ncbi:calcium-binding protein, partial [Rhizobium ruizarguesonis]|uniref:calcium-binding protein n=1 Tax=Rhizobium ruizarguesonis TaxID=2081791 RepID=UPI00158217C5
HARVVGTVDMGAYESGSSATPGTPTTPTQPGTPTTPTEPTTPTQPSSGSGTPTTPTQPTEPTTQPTTPTTSTKVYTGTDGNDYLPHTGQSNGGNETYKGLGGNDVLKGGAGADVLDGGSGRDTASYEGSGAVHVNLATGAASGGHATGDKFISIENLTGSSYNDVLTGDSGRNVLHGGAGADVITGGAGKDIMTGGASSDTFVFKTPTETGSGWNRDVITDFQHGIDKIDLSAIDANGSAAGNGTFHFQAQENALFDHKAGALAWHYDDHAGSASDATVIQADMNGDGIHDFEVQLKGLVHLGAGDFLL